MVALGTNCAGLMTRDDAMARRLVRAGNDTHERLWRLPLWDEHVTEMKGDTTDLKNLGGRFGGASTAGAATGSVAACELLQATSESAEAASSARARCANEK